MTQPCLPDGVTFSYQTEIDSFQFNYQNCTEIGGTVRIKGNDIINLYGLSSLSSINGNLYIEDCSNLITLSGLENLHTLNGTLNIQFDSILININGLNNLTSINGKLFISRNINLTSISALNSLTFIGSGIYIVSNHKLTNLDGLNNIDTIRSSVEIGDNKLANLEGLNNLKSISGSLHISGCNYLENLEGLDNLSQINRNLEIVGNPLLHDLTSLNSIVKIGEGLTIQSNNMLKDLTGLENITHIDSALEVFLNDSLENLSGLDNLSFIGDQLSIEGNNSLTSLSGLESLTTMKWTSACNIGYNPVLTDIQGIANIDFKSTFLISFYENTLLSDCDVKSICEAIENPNVLTLFNNNNKGCNTEMEVEQACNSASIDENSKCLLFFPNPASKQITISNNYANDIYKIYIYNLNGQIIYKETSPKYIINLSEFVKGLYFIAFDINETRIIRKLIVQ